MMFRGKHRRAQSDFTEQSGLSKCRIEPLPGLNENSYDPMSDMVLVSPTTKRISGPRAVDADKMQEFSAQKICTMQLMCQKASKECEELKLQYKESPTETNHSNLESKVKVLRRLQSQISQQISEPEVLTPFAGTPSLTPFSDKPSEMSSQFYYPVVPRKLIESEHFGIAAAGSDLARTRSSVHRSHSDRCNNKPLQVLKNISGDKLRQTASTDELFKLNVLSSGAVNDCRNHSSYNDISSDISSDTTNEPLSPLSLHGPANEYFADPYLTAAKVPVSQQLNILALDDYDFLSDDEDIHESGGPFSDFNLLKDRPAHLAIFLHYLISNSDPSPLLFYLTADTFQLGSGREMMHRWAYEIYCNFLGDHAPLKININALLINSIHTVIQSKHDKEDTVKILFRAAAAASEMLVKDLLADFGVKRSLGLGSLYGDHELQDNMDHSAELRIIENVLWKHFERLIQDERNERSLAMASSLATFFKRVGYTSLKNIHLQERCSVFNARDKTKFLMFGKTKQKMIFQRGHQFQSQLYSVETFCQLCHVILCSVGNQGYQCTKCDQNFHKICLDDIKESCAGKKSRTAFSVEKKGVSKQKSFLVKDHQSGEEKYRQNAALVPPSQTLNKVVLEPIRDFDQTEQPKRQEEEPNTNFGSFSSIQKNPSSGTIQQSQNQPQAQTSDHKRQSSYATSQFYSSPNELPADAPLKLYSDSDLETEPTLPVLDTVISKEFLKKMKPKDKKRQEVINELFYTERAHVRNLKVMYNLFFIPMKMNRELSADFVNLLFPNLKEMIELHGSLNKDFKLTKLKSENGIVGDFAEILNRHFSGREGDKFKEICATFCEKQSHALEVLKVKQRKDQKFAFFIQEASNNLLCRRLELKDLLPTAMQRLTKYPLLMENLLKYTTVETDEYGKLQLAYFSTKEIATYVNKSVQNFENNNKLAELQKRLEKRPMEDSNNLYVDLYKNLDLTKHKLVFDGPLIWRITSTKLISLHVILFEDILVLLQKQDDKLILRFQSTMIDPRNENTRRTHSPIMKVSEVLVKPVANDKCAFFLVSTSKLGPQIYTLIASTKDEKNMWCKYITSTFDGMRVTGESLNFSKMSFPDMKKSVPVEDHEYSQKDGEITEMTKDDKLFGYDKGSDEKEKLDPIEEVQELNDFVHKKMYEKQEILSEMHHVTQDEEPTDGSPDISIRDDANLIILSLIYQVNHLMGVINESKKYEDDKKLTDAALLADATEKEKVVGTSTNDCCQPFLSSSQLINLSNTLHQQLTHLLIAVKRKDSESKQLMVDLEQAKETFALLQDLSLSNNKQIKTISCSTDTLTSDLTRETSHEEITPL